MHLFGLTGGIASGKSSVAARLRDRGVPVIDADILSREAVALGTEGLAKVVESFGAEVVHADGSLNRAKLASIVFNDEPRRKALNAILHPIVADLTMRRASQLQAQGHPLACYEAALIIENGMADAFRPLVVVAAPEEDQVARATARDHAAEADVRARIRAQMPLTDKTRVADFVIHNDGTRAELEQRTDEVLGAICQRLGIPLDALRARSGQKC